MADLSITVANIQVASDDVQTSYDQASAAITQGQVVRYTATTRKWAPAINSAEVPVGTRLALALTKAAADNDYLIAAMTGKLILGATLVVGTTYFLSDTSGGIMPEGDLATGNWVVRVGVAETSSILRLDFDPAGVQRP